MRLIPTCGGYRRVRDDTTEPRLQRGGQRVEVPPPQILVVRAREQVPARRVQQQRANAANVTVERGHAVHSGQSPCR